ncbi:helix-turn-helix transcriptional regulator [Adlercreutzia sp. R21]|uniref:helix-turn-helix transcriptional regulator n=1 Tax=Adlercreutzia wanghongyangiae TaxID=3111451 RepID=UPI002DB6390F|nr:helix-turn-helix transcriptional regulator [Adlercreutzia sp. R21]MEC4183580.1 helix-turn-helix transcriptional regulator [Adlercreutzia sp. R21]
MDGVSLGRRLGLDDRASVLDFCVVLFGLALCRVWIILCLSAPFALAELESSDWLFLLPGGMTALVAALVATRAADRVVFDGRFKTAVGVLAALFSAVTPVVASLQHPWLLGLFMVLGGTASGCLQMLWGAAFARRSQLFCLYCYPATAVVTAVMVAVVLAGGELLVFCVFPLASFLLLLVASEGSGSGSEATKAEVPAEAADESALPLSTIVRLLISIAVFSFLCRFFDGLPAGDMVDPLAVIGGSSLFALVVTGVGFLGFVAVAGRTFNPLIGYRVALPLMAAGMTVIALFFAHHWYLSILLIGMGYELFDTLTWILLVVLAQNQRVRWAPLTVFGLGTAATMLGMGVGRLAGVAVSAGLASGAWELPSVGVACVMTLVITAFLVIPEGTFAQLAGIRIFDRGEQLPADEDAAAEVAAVAGRHPLEAACMAVAEEYRLTPREGEVLFLLARGRTLAIVVRDLGIAKGTAQTHMENVYHKLGVHKQQELIDLVESYVEG